MDTYKYYKWSLDKAIKENDLGDEADRKHKLNIYYARETKKMFLDEGFTEESYEYCNKWNCCYNCPFFDETVDDDGLWFSICTLPKDIVNYKDKFIEKQVKDNGKE